MSLRGSGSRLGRALKVSLGRSVVIFTRMRVGPIRIGLRGTVRRNLRSHLRLHRHRVRDGRLTFSVVGAGTLGRFGKSVTLSFNLVNSGQRLRGVCGGPARGPHITVDFDIPVFS